VAYHMVSLDRATGVPPPTTWPSMVAADVHPAATKAENMINVVTNLRRLFGHMTQAMLSIIAPPSSQSVEGQIRSIYFGRHGPKTT
jgi:hypothetical protein